MRYGSHDLSSDSREKAVLHINLLVAAGRLSDAVIVTRKSRQSEHDMEMFNCLLEKCQQGVSLYSSIQIYSMQTLAVTQIYEHCKSR